MGMLAAGGCCALQFSRVSGPNIQVVLRYVFICTAHVQIVVVSLHLKSIRDSLELNMLDSDIT